MIQIVSEEEGGADRNSSVVGKNQWMTGEPQPRFCMPHACFWCLRQVCKSEEVVSIFGEPLKAYGIDHGGHREGRRNFIQSREYEGEDGTKRLKVRFNLQGPYAGGIVFAETSDKLNSKNGEWVYLVVQSKKTGQAITLCDNRQALAAMAAATTPEVCHSYAALLMCFQASTNTPSSARWSTTGRKRRP